MGDQCTQAQVEHHQWSEQLPHSRSLPSICVPLRIKLFRFCSFAQHRQRGEGLSQSLSNFISPLTICPVIRSSAPAAYWGDASLANLYIFISIFYKSSA